MQYALQRRTFCILVDFSSVILSHIFNIITVMVRRSNGIDICDRQRQATVRMSMRLQAWSEEPSSTVSPAPPTPLTDLISLIRCLPVSHSTHLFGEINPIPSKSRLGPIARPTNRTRMPVRQPISDSQYSPTSDE